MISLRLKGVNKKTQSVSFLTIIIIFTVAAILAIGYSFVKFLLGERDGAYSPSDSVDISIERKRTKNEYLNKEFINKTICGKPEKEFAKELFKHFQKHQPQDKQTK